MAEFNDGVGGPDEKGDEGSVIQSRWLFVATSFATEWARVFMGVTWKTGNESLPSYMPRVDRMTLMKCMQVFCSKGSDDDLVRSLTSATEMFPTTLEELSTTGKDETPSWCNRVRPSARLLSPLQMVSIVVVLLEWGFT